jgi:cellulose synthase/poly-beta-1,6-N-acetylglucosamine synthase-like glycosyltransferase
MLKSILFGIFMGATLFFAPFFTLFFGLFFFVVSMRFKRRMRNAYMSYSPVPQGVYAMSGFESVLFTNRKQDNRVISID